MATPGIVHRALGRVMRQLQLRGVKSVHFSFDPYGQDVASIRYTLFQLHSPKLLQTNPKVTMKVDVKADRSPPVMAVTFADGDILNLKTANLSNLEILTNLRKYFSLKDPKQHEPASKARTKSSKKKK